MATFLHDGISFHYAERGQGTPFFFLHGLGSDLRQPLSLFQPPAGIRLIGFDARAHGMTSPPGEAKKIRLATSADDLLALMDLLKVKQAIVGGISMGAAIALNFALRNPTRSLGLVLSRPAWLDRPNPWNVTMFSLVARLIREHGPQRGQELFRKSSEYLEALQMYPDVAKSLATQFENPRAVENVVNLEQIPQDSPCANREDWSLIRVPTLVMANRQDPIHPFEYGKILASAISGAQFRELTAKSVDVARHNQEVQFFLEEFIRNHSFASVSASILPSAL